jgi:hypothetical protein
MSASYDGVQRHADYIASPAWRARRARHLLVHPVCEVTGSRVELHVHHIRYSGLDALGPGQEPEEDLITLNSNVHAEVHGEERRLFEHEPDRRALDRDVTLQDALRIVLARYGRLVDPEPVRPIKADRLPVVVGLGLGGFLLGGVASLLVGGMALLTLWMVLAPVIYALAVKHGRRHTRGGETWSFHG